MTQYNTLNVKLSNSQLNKLKSTLKNGTKVTLNLSSNVVRDSNDRNDFAHNLSLTDIQVSPLRKPLANYSSANIKSSKTQLHKIVQSGRFSSRLLEPLLKSGLLLTGNVLKSLAKSVLTLFRMRGDEGGGRCGQGGMGRPPYQFFPCNFYKRRIWSPKLSDF